MKLNLLNYEHGINLVQIYYKNTIYNLHELEASLLLRYTYVTITDQALPRNFVAILILVKSKLSVH